jgi:hypothetical protein
MKILETLLLIVVICNILYFTDWQRVISRGHMVSILDGKKIKPASLAPGSNVLATLPRYDLTQVSTLLGSS